MPQPLFFASLDIETRINLPLARAVLHAGPEVSDTEVRRRLSERRRAETGGNDFQKLPFHEPISAALLLCAQADAAPDSPLLATEWLLWRPVAGEAEQVPIETFVEQFFQAVAGRTFVGFHSRNFDLPLMNLWASRCRLAAPRPTLPGGAEPHCDVQKELATGASGAGSLDELCKFHGLPGKVGVTGAEVETLVTTGRLEELIAYNVSDTLQTWLLFLHLQLRNGKLSRPAAAESARSSLALTRQTVLAELKEGGAARAMLQSCLAGCERAPLAQD